LIAADCRAVAAVYRLAIPGLLVEVFAAVHSWLCRVRSLERLTSQELITSRAEPGSFARVARESAEQQESPSVRLTFENAERVYLDLAAKCERLAGASA
jgi:hypothetical protein